ncbi:hypothetical protein LSCM1_00504 [Leishmania martiniquensis]|uniref:NADPH--hemoprotein reductase n=1 Tax=Leishmania martiniquensis TaxID=1580590 RepID=A0A836FKL9_9TRYP|nr:hypothetical protein LSCM1_00504 [Leishmania martiniquensis]
MSGRLAETHAAERLYVLYGSETGNAESIAKHLHHDAISNHGFVDAECMTLNQAVSRKLFDAQLADDAATSLCVVIVCSTTGDGEPPQNAARFRRWLRNTTGTLHNTRYCLLALGDKNYNNFCAPGIFIDKRLSDMGAARFYPRGEADDGIGLHLVVNPWMEGLWGALKSSSPAGHDKDATATTHTDTLASQEAAILYSSTSPLCTTTAVFLHERITELGGEAEVYPIQYVNPSILPTRPSAVLLFIFDKECDAGTIGYECSSTDQGAPSLGPFSAWVGNRDPGAPSPAETAELQRWMADSPIRFFDALLISRQADAATAGAVLKVNLKTFAANGKVELLTKRQLSGEVLSVAVSDKDVLLWLEKVLGSLPGIRADAEDIHRSLEASFHSCVGAAFLSAQTREVLEGHGAESGDDAISGGAPARARQRYRRRDIEDDCGAGDTERPNTLSVTYHDGSSSRDTRQVLENKLAPTVYIYSEESPWVDQWARDIFSEASELHLRSFTEDLSNFGHSGLPHYATFVFVVSGVLTASMAHVLSVLRTLLVQQKHLDDASFAILSIDQTSRREKFNVCAARLEALLMELKAKKIGSTLLADVDNSSFLSIMESWKSNLWNAILNLVKNGASLATASLNMGTQRSVAPLAVIGSPATAALSLAGASANGSADLDSDDRDGASGSNGLAASHMCGDCVNDAAIASTLPGPCSSVPSRALDTPTSTLPAPSVLVGAGGDVREQESTLPFSALGGAAALGTGTTMEHVSLAPTAVSVRTAPTRPRRALLAYFGAPSSVVEGLLEYLVQTIAKSTSVVPMTRTANELITQNWRGEFDLIVFIVGHSKGTERVLNGSALAKAVWRHTAPRDMLSGVLYTVLTVSKSDPSHSYLGRQLDRRFEELGGTRAYPCGEVDEASGIEKVATWSSGLLDLLTSSSENHLIGSKADATAHENWPLKSLVCATESSPGRNAMPDGKGVRPMVQRPCVPSDAATEDAGLRGTEPFASRSAALCPDALASTRGGAVRTVDDSLGEAEEDCEKAPSFPSQDGGIHSADVSTEHDGVTEPSEVSWCDDSADNAGDCVDGVIQSWKVLTCPRVRHPVVQLDLLVSAGMQWVPGQTISVFPSNCVEEVDALLRLFGLNPDDSFLPPPLDGPAASLFPTAPLYQAANFPVSCRALLLRYVELRVTGWHKALFELLERHCVCEEAKAAVRDMYAEVLTSGAPRKLREVLEAVFAVAGSLPPLRHVVENLSLMCPRQYSICSSHRANPTTLSICFKVVEGGLCTGWLYEQCMRAAGLPLVSSVTADFLPAQAKTVPSTVRHPVRSKTVVLASQPTVIPFVIRKASAFCMPLDPLVPMILIGSGTGIAPFRAFLQERDVWLAEHRMEAHSTSPRGERFGYHYEAGTPPPRADCGSIDIFFGCRHPSEDYLFGDELAQWKENGVVRSLTVAFSRDAADHGGHYGSGCYVQDKMQECEAALMDLILERKAHIFVCGDADGMANAVHGTLRQLLQQHLSLTEGAAARHLEQMRKDRRYLRDVWSARGSERIVAGDAELITRRDTQP